MNKLLFTMTTLATALATTGVATAGESSRAGRATGWTMLTEVSADPRDGSDDVEIGRDGRFTRLELLAQQDEVLLGGITVYLDDGRVVRPRVSGKIAKGDRLYVDLPADTRGIERIEIDYGDRDRRAVDRTAARLQIWAFAETGRAPRDRYDRDRYDRDRYDRDRYDRDRYDRDRDRDARDGWYRDYDDLRDRYGHRDGDGYRDGDGRDRHDRDGYYFDPRSRAWEREWARYRHHERDVYRGRMLAHERVTNRRGTVTFVFERPLRGEDVELLLSDPSIQVRRIELTFAGGRTAMVSPGYDRDGRIELDTRGRAVRSMTVSYVNRERGPGAIAVIRH